MTSNRDGDAGGFKQMKTQKSYTSIEQMVRPRKSIIILHCDCGEEISRVDWAPAIAGAGDALNMNFGKIKCSCGAEYVFNGLLSLTVDSIPRQRAQIAELKKDAERRKENRSHAA